MYYLYMTDELPCVLFLFLQERTEKKTPPPDIFCRQHSGARLAGRNAARCSCRGLPPKGWIRISGLFDKPRLMGVASHLPSPKLT